MFRLWALTIGVGLALSPIHNKWLTDLFTTGRGEVAFFLPAFGTAIWLMASLWIVVDYWEDIKKIGWGDRRIVIPLIIIAVAIGLSGITAGSLGAKLAPLFMAFSMFCLYAASRMLGRDMFLPVAIGAAIALLGVIAWSFKDPGIRTGGYVFEQNYDILVGYCLIGLAMFLGRWRPWLAGLALVAMFLSGSPEAVLAVAIVGVAALIRRDWSRTLTVAAGVTVIVAAIYLGLGYGRTLYLYTVQIISNRPELLPGQSVYNPGEQLYADHTTLEKRWLLIVDAVKDLKPLGEGYNVSAFHPRIVHNVPMIIVQQLGWPGIAAAAAWLWVSIYCLVTTRWKYVWILILGLSVFDHYVWTQIGPWWWAIVGITTTETIRNDYIFRKQPELATQDHMELATQNHMELTTQNHMELATQNH